MDPAFIPDDQFKPDDVAAPPVESVRSPASAAVSSSDVIPDSEFVPDDVKYGTLPQQALTVAEGLGKGYLGPVATAAESALTSSGIPGLTPEEQAGRSAANPWESGLSRATGFGAGILTGTGEAQLLSSAGQGALKAAGVLSKPATLIGRSAASALSGAVETALFQGGDEISKKINNPEESTAGAITNIGLGGLIGAAGGALLGPIMPIWAHTHGEAVEQGLSDFRSAMSGGVADHAAEAPAREIEKSGLLAGLKEQKPNARALENIADRNGWDLAEGILSGSKEIQKAEDALLNGPPTVASLSRQKIYNDIYSKMDSAVDQAASAPTSLMTETEAGSALKSSLSSKLEAENAPIKAGYKEIEPYQQAIPVGDRSTGSLSRNIEKIIEEQNLIKGTDRYNFVKTMAEGIDQVDNLQRLKNFRTEVWRNSGPMTKDLAGIVADKLNGVESRAIRRYAETMKTPVAKQKILEVAEKLDKVNSEYGPFKEKLKELGKNIGKSKVHGPQDFIDFIDDMNPQKLVKRLFNEGNTEFSRAFSKQFPEEFGLMRGYQRGLIRQEAMKDGVFNMPKAIKSVLKLEPEMQKLLYSDAELQVLKDADHYLQAFPKKFNPSGTDHTSAFRAFFEHPTGAAIANLRDYGIQSFIKGFGRSVPGADKEAHRLLPLLGSAAKNAESNPGAFKHAVEYAMATIKGETLTSKAVKNVFETAGPIAAMVMPKEDHLESLDKKLKESQVSPEKYAPVGGGLGHYLPNHDIALKAATMNAANYVNNARPAPKKSAPLDKELKPGHFERSKFNRLLAVANQPLITTGWLKSGQLTAVDVANLKAMYPAVHASLSQKLSSEIADHLAKGGSIPYSVKRGLSLFLGQPMDTTQSPQSMQAIIMANAPKNPHQQAPAGQNGRVGKSTASSMQKVNSMYQTPAQARAAERNQS